MKIKISRNKQLCKNKRIVVKQKKHNKSINNFSKFKQNREINVHKKYKNNKIILKPITKNKQN